MRSRRPLLLLLLLLLLLPFLLAACLHAGTRDVEERREEAQEKPPRPLVSFACLERLEARDTRAIAVSAEFEEKHALVRALADNVAAAGESLDTARADVEHAAAGLDRTDAEAVAAYNARVARYERRRRSYNEAVRAHNRTAREVTALARGQTRLARAYAAALERCLARGGRFAEAEKERLARLEATIAEAVAELAGARPSVRCQPSEAWRERRGRKVLGFVPEGGRSAHLAPSVCYALHRLFFLATPFDLSCLERSRSARLPLCGPDAHLLLRAVTTVSHEAQHVAGIRDESEAECRGLRAAPRVGRAFALPPREARLLAWYAHRFPHTPPQYRARPCRLHPALA